MGDLPTKMDKLLDILEMIAKEGEVSLTSIGRKMKTRISGIKIYVEYLEELGLIYRVRKGNTTYVRPIRDVVTRVGDTMVAITGDTVFVWRCPFKDICPYYKTGCTTTDKCFFTKTVIPAIEEALEEYDSDNGNTEVK